MKRIWPIAVILVLGAVFLLWPRRQADRPAGESATVAGCDYEPAAQWLSMRAAREGSGRPALVMSFRGGARLPDGAGAKHAALVAYLSQIRGAIGKNKRLSGVVMPPVDLGGGRVAFEGSEPSAVAAHALRELLPGVFDPEGDARRAADRRREYLLRKGLRPAELPAKDAFTRLAARFTVTPPSGVPCASAHVDVMTVAVFNRDLDGGQDIICQEADRGVAEASAERLGGGKVLTPPLDEFQKRLRERKFDVAVVSFIRGKGAEGLDHTGSSAAWDLLMQSLPESVRAQGLDGGFPSDAPLRVLREAPLYVAGSPEALRKLGLGVQR